MLTFFSEIGYNNKKEKLGGMNMTKIEIERINSYEYGLPSYLQQDLDAFKIVREQGSMLLDCLWGELYGSINMAEISDGLITPEHADYLRQKYLWG